MTLNLKPYYQVVRSEFIICSGQLYESICGHVVQRTNMHSLQTNKTKQKTCRLTWLQRDLRLLGILAGHVQVAGRAMWSRRPSKSRKKI